MSELFRYFCGRRTPLVGGDDLYSSLLSNEVAIVPRATYCSASRCTKFATLDEHAAELASAVKDPLLPAQKCRTYLERAVEAGILLPYSTVHRWVVDGLKLQEPRKSIGVIGIATRNRPQVLDRALSSISAHLAEFSRSAHIVIVDDSDDPEVQAQNSSVAASAAKANRISISYGNHQTTKQYVEKLAVESGVKHHIAEFALLNPLRHPVSVGACRNTILLETIGHTILYLDDDVLCKIATIPGSSDHVVFANEGFHSWFFPQMDRLQAYPFTGENLFDLHERAINIDRNAILNGFGGGPLDVSTISSACLQCIRQGRASVAISLVGIIGDAATEDPLIFFLQGSETIARLTSSEETYHAALKNRLVLYGSRNTIVADYLPCMAYCMAVNNENLMPPFFPVARGEEFVFGALVSRCVRGALFVANPRAVLHRPPQHREFDFSAALERAGKLTFAETLAVLIGTAGVRGSGTNDLLQSMSQRLAELSACDAFELRRILRELVEPLVSAQVCALDHAIRDCPEHARFCRNDLLLLKKAFVHALNSNDYSVPLDLPSSNHESSNSCFRELLANFSGVLQAWPQLMDGSKRLRVKGIRPCEPVCAQH